MMKYFLFDFQYSCLLHKIMLSVGFTLFLWSLGLADEVHISRPCKRSTLSKHDDNPEKNLKQRHYYLSKRAASGDTEAMYQLGIFFQKGLADEKSNQKASVWFKKAYDRGHQQSGLQYAGQLLSKGGIIDIEESLAILKILADNGMADAQYHVGWAYEYGLLEETGTRGGIQENEIPNSTVTSRWLSVLIQTDPMIGATFAEGDWGMCDGIRPIPSTAIKYYKKAAANSNANGQIKMIFMPNKYENNKSMYYSLLESMYDSNNFGVLMVLDYALPLYGTAVNYPKANELDKKCAKKFVLVTHREAKDGNPVAQRALSVMYQEGMYGIERRQEPEDTLGK